MKKLLTLVLALMMVLNCTLALATDADGENETQLTATEKIDVRVPDQQWTKDAATMDSAYTELWLQVDASGQIDVTVPLVLVFQTSIDGGYAKTAGEDIYKITNNSSADLVVTGLKVTVEDEDEEDAVRTAASNPMELVAFAAPGTLAEDTYGVQVTVDEQTDSWGEKRAMYTKDIFALNGQTNQEDTVAANQGGLFLLKKAAAGGTGTATEVKVEMSTGKLSFVTARTVDGEDNDVKNDEYGVKLLTLTYTVAIDTSNGIGEKITTGIGSGTGDNTGDNTGNNTGN